MNLLRGRKLDTGYSATRNSNIAMENSHIAIDYTWQDNSNGNLGGPCPVRRPQLRWTCHNVPMPGMYAGTTC
jgi:hypothetical protein